MFSLTTRKKEFEMEKIIIKQATKRATSIKRKMDHALSNIDMQLMNLMGLSEEYTGLLKIIGSEEKVIDAEKIRKFIYQERNPDKSTSQSPQDIKPVDESSVDPVVKSAVIPVGGSGAQCGIDAFNHPVRSAVIPTFMDSVPVNEPLEECNEPEELEYCDDEGENGIGMDEMSDNAVLNALENDFKGGTVSETPERGDDVPEKLKYAYLLDVVTDGVAKGYAQRMPGIVIDEKYFLNDLMYRRKERGFNVIELLPKFIHRDYVDSRIGTIDFLERYSDWVRGERIPDGRPWANRLPLEALMIPEVAAALDKLENWGYNAEVMMFLRKYEPKKETV